MHYFTRKCTATASFCIKKTILVAALSTTLPMLAASNAEAAKVGACLKVVNVDPFDVLYIREKPDYRSAKTGAIAPDSESPIVVTGPCTPPGATSRKLWCPITYYVTKDTSRKGYVKMYFTQEVPCPPSLEFYKQ